MAVVKETFIKDVSTFINESLRWCKDESEKESTTILIALQNVMEDVKRRSKMSAAAEDSLRDAQQKLSAIVASAEGVALDELLNELQSLKSDNAEVNRLVNPVIEALQFQDRLVQNLQNIEKVMECWFKYETESLKNGHETIENQARKEALIKDLLKCVTTAEERQLVRKNFGLAENEQSLARSA